jgi:hypothetical protein
MKISSVASTRALQKHSEFKAKSKWKDSNNSQVEPNFAAFGKLCRKNLFSHENLIHYNLFFITTEIQTFRLN